MRGRNEELRGTSCMRNGSSLQAHSSIRMCSVGQGKCTFRSSRRCPRGGIGARNRGRGYHGAILPHQFRKDITSGVNTRLKTPWPATLSATTATARTRGRSSPIAASDGHPFRNARWGPSPCLLAGFGDRCMGAVLSEEVFQNNYAEQYFVVVSTPLSMLVQ